MKMYAHFLSLSSEFASNNKDCTAVAANVQPWAPSRFYSLPLSSPLPHPFSPVLHTSRRCNSETPICSHFSPGHRASLFSPPPPPPSPHRRPPTRAASRDSPRAPPLRLSSSRAVHPPPGDCVGAGGHGGLGVAGASSSRGRRKGGRAGRRR
jgi:hypothetical protein